MMRWFKRLVVWCTVKRLIPVLAHILILGELMMLPVFSEPREHSRGFYYALKEGGWVRAGKDEYPAQFSDEIRTWVFFRPRRQDVVIWFLLPWVRFDQQVRGIELEWTPESDKNATRQDALLRTYLADEGFDPQLAKYLPAGGLYAPRLVPLGITFNLIFFLILSILFGRVFHRRTIRRFLSHQQWRDRVLHCPSCKYNRTNLLDRPCPECGWGDNPAEL